MQQGGETEISLRTLQTQALQAQAQVLRSKGRFGDTLLAHISPEEARLLKAHGGAGTINPETGLLEFYDSAPKEGKYIWHTQGDGKVRSAHAERNGKTYSWNDPPEGGHPGEAPNCRCWAEDVASEDAKCEEIKRLMEEAWDRHDVLHKSIQDAKYRVAVSESILSDLRSELTAIELELAVAMVPGSLSRKPPLGDIIDVEQKRREIQRLLNRKNQIEVRIAIEERTLARGKETLDELKREQGREWEAATEYSRRFKACEENGKSRAKSAQ